MPIFDPVFRALNASGTRYVIVGGIATVLHGFIRVTQDADVVLDLSPESARRALEALVGIGLRPRAPVDPLLFADARQRQAWIEEKGLTVFTMDSTIDPRLRVDLFVSSPFPFDDFWSRAEEMDVGGYTVRVAAIDDLIAMKRPVGRPQDLQDIEALEAIRRKRAGRDPG